MRKRFGRPAEETRKPNRFFCAFVSLDTKALFNARSRALQVGLCADLNHRR